MRSCTKPLPSFHDAPGIGNCAPRRTLGVVAARAARCFRAPSHSRWGALAQQGGFHDILGKNLASRFLGIGSTTALDWLPSVVKASTKLQIALALKTPRQRAWIYSLMGLIVYRRPCSIFFATAMLVLEPIFEADLPTRAIRLPPRAKRPTGGGRGEGAAVRRPPGSRGRRPRGLLREHPPCRAITVGGAPGSLIGACCI